MCSYCETKANRLQQTQIGPLASYKEENDRFYFDHSGDVTVKARGGRSVVRPEGSRISGAGGTPGMEVD